MATTFGSGELTLTTTEQALGGALEVNWLIFRTLKGADLCAVGATGVAVGSDLTLIGGEGKFFGPCNLEEVFAIGSNDNDTDVLFYAYASGTSTGGIAVVQDTAANLLATVTPHGWSHSGEENGNAVISAAAGQLHGILIETDGTNDVTAQLFDDPDSADTPVTPAIVVAGGDNYGGVMGIDVAVSNGIYLTLSGGTPVAVVYYR